MIWLLLACEGDVEETAAPEPERAVTFSGESPQNLLVLTLDTVRVQRLARYGGDDTMPLLEARLEQSVVLDDHRSCSNWTFTSMACMLAGQTAMDLAWSPWAADPDDLDRVPETVSLLAERLQRHGYRTALVSSNPFLDPRYGFGQGFDDAWTVTDATADEVVVETLAFVEALDVPGSPWMVHAHFMDPHTPYAPPEDYLEGRDELPDMPWTLTTPEGLDELQAAWSELSADEQAAVLAHLELRYAGELRYLDDQLQRLLSGLEEAGHLDDTLVVFATDHGEQIFDRDELGHGFTLHPEEARALVAFWSTGIVPLAWDEPTTHIDVLPTVLTAMGLPPGKDWTGEIAGRAAPDRPLLAWRLAKEVTRQDVTVGDLRLELRWDGALSLYDRSGDPDELEDLYVAGDARAVELWAHLAEPVEQLSELYTGYAAEAVSP